ncbi:MAG: hypothetical protein ACR2PO_19490 [Methyloligellaceae bacterium]
MKRSAATLTLCLGATALFGFATMEARAAMFELKKDQVDAAVAHGKKHFEQHPTAFRWAYLKDTGYGYPSVLMRTEYLAVADYVRRAEFQRKYGSQRAHKLTDKRIQDARSEVAGHLQFVVTIYGPSADFMKAHKFHLMAGDKKIEPANVDKPVMAENSGFKGKLAYKAVCFVDFAAKALKGNEKVTLVVDPPAGMGPSGQRNADFKVPFDLAAVK